MNRQTLFSALACALLAFSMGCGSTNKLQSIQISTSNLSETPPGTLDLFGIGGTLQVYTWGNYSSGKTRVLSNEPVQYQIALSPGTQYAVDPSNGALYPLSAPPETVELSTNGLLTAITPSACTWQNTATSGTTPGWAIVGTYSVTATVLGFTSPPVFVAVASAPGFTSPTNPQGLCGPTPSAN